MTNTETTDQESQEELAQTLPDKVRTMNERIQRWIALATDELDCALASAEHQLLKPPQALDKTHTFVVMLDYNAKEKNDSLAFTVTKMDLLPNSAITEITQRSEEERNKLCRLTLKSTPAIKFLRVLHEKDYIFFLPFGVRDRTPDKQLCRLQGAPDFWKDPKWQESLLRRLKRSAFTTPTSNGMPERLVLDKKQW